MADRQQGSLELWGGVECTVVRIGDEWRNQVAETGHLTRDGDIDAIAALGVKAVRYPIVWETVAPDSPDRLDFAWHDARLERLQAHGVRVIAGLVHHGSGPRYTDLLDPEFPAKLADYAGRVAERYAWIEDWTPVNEPLTTARFACLYGHWYPHRRSMGEFLRALALECAGTQAAMVAIRRHVPGARLLQTEDLGKIWSTPKLAYQARHENERRWLSLDLLCGRVQHGHPWRRAFADAGVPSALLEALADGSATPDLVGINHYLTSERFLDDRLDFYPGEPGGNARHRYHDVEAVRVPELAGLTGPRARLQEAWDRYGIPLVVSEVHHGCSREEQLRWFVEVWNACEELLRNGVDVRAVTLWSLFGAVDWRSLITRREGHYDTGAFDTRSPTPRPTIVAKAAATLAAGRRFEHPALDAPGWWHRPERFYAPLVGSSVQASPSAPTQAHPLLITGATGTLGRAFARIARHRGLPHVLTARPRIDITDAVSIEHALDELRPWAVINTAGFVRVAEAEHQPDACFAINTTGAELLASACARRGLPFVTFSSDLVFDGQLGRPYHERDETRPGCVYGSSKAEAEARVLAAWERSLVIRSSAFFGPWDRYNFVWAALNTIDRGLPFHASDQVVVTPTYVPDLVHGTLDLLLDDETGIWHLANVGPSSWASLARRVASEMRLDASLVVEPAGAKAANTALTSERGLILRPLDHAVDSFLADCEVDWRAAA